VAAGASVARAQSNVLLRIVVPYAAGGTTDVIARAMAIPMSSKLGRNVVVENRLGASGLLAAQYVKAAGSEGNHLLFMNNAFVLVPLLQKSPAYDAVRDFTPLGTVCRVVNFLAVHSSVPANTLAEFIAYAKSRPEGIPAATVGVSSTGYLQTLMFAHATGINLTPVPYRGTQETAIALSTGEVKVQLTTLNEFLNSQVRSGNIKLIAVAAPTRLPSMPQLATIREVAPGMDFSDGWFGMVTGAGCPPETVERLHQAIRASISNTGVLERLKAVSMEPLPSTPAEHRVMIAQALATYTNVIAHEHIPLS
jgi:tripartite-type tricarboxylate transporter receptor subunit TctC